ncbi:MAG TPA: type I DNA topoisomerase, partial [bacterium]|nr:type I DNA topoisomerase [bacterium]
LQALAAPRTVDMHRVDAQQARRVLDRLVGYTLSPFLWKKVVRGLSAGRVQSVALRFVVERERERDAFHPVEYWSIAGDFQLEAGMIRAGLHAVDGRKIGQGDQPQDLLINSASQAQALKERLQACSYQVGSVEKKERQRAAYPPFTTSTLQMEAARKLRFSANKTMLIAQQLYEGIEISGGERTGLITYMRTDSLNLAQTAVEEAREHISRKFGEKYLPAKPIFYKTKTKGAQEAHEAIRPTSFHREPESLKAYLNADQYQLYDLIYKRSLSCQMQKAVYDQTGIDITDSVASVTFRATGQVLRFDGFLRVYEEGSDDEQSTNGEDRRLPQVREQEAAELKKLEAEQHFTQPPPRFSEATLVKTLESHGIGRPSTYAPILSTIVHRGYVRLEQRRFVPEDVGYIVNDLLVEHFPDIVDSDFTAEMEENLDAIAAGELTWVPVVREFYVPFAKQVEEKEDSVERQAIIKDLGSHPDSGKPMTVKIGRYGPYVQIGDKDDADKPRFASIPKTIVPQEITLEQALQLFDLPRVVGEINGSPVEANIGRFGPYVKHAGKFYSIKDEDPYTIDIARAQELIAAAQEKQAKALVKRFDGVDIEIRSGRYGHYVTDGKKNAKIPKGSDPIALTLPECEALLAAAPDRKKRGRKKK